MTELSQQARPAAQVADGIPPSGPAVLQPVRGSGRVGPVHIIQLLLVQAAVVAVLAALTQGVLAMAAATIGGAVLLVVTLGRWRGRWWLERWLMRWQYQRRRLARPPPYPADVRLAALQVLAPGLTVNEEPVADGSQVGVARDDAGWFAVAAVSPGTTTGEGPGAGLPVAALAAALAEASQPGAVLQLVWHTVPAPSLDTDPKAPVGQSYHQLLAGFGGRPVPMDQATWVAVRLDARSLAEAGADRTDLEPAPAVVAALLRGVAKPLRRAGIGYQVLDAAGLVAALARSCGLEPAAAAGPPPAPQEEWTRWLAGGLAHRSYWIRSWPRIDHAASLLDRLAIASLATTNVALVLAPAEHGLFDMRCVVRVAAPASVLGHACQVMTGTAGQLRAELFALDGEQGPAVYASAPTGGGPR